MPLVVARSGHSTIVVSGFSGLYGLPHMSLFMHLPWAEALLSVYHPQTRETEEPAQSAEDSQNGSTLIVICEEVEMRAVAMSAEMSLTM